MLLPLPPPPACSILRPAPPHHLLPLAAPVPTLLFPARLLRSRTPPLRKHLPSPTSTSASHPSAFSFTSSFPATFQRNPSREANGEYDEEESVVGDCLVFEEGAFEGGDPFLRSDPEVSGEAKKGIRKPPRRKPDVRVDAEDLVPEKWRELVAEINLTKKEKRRIAQELKFGSRLERRKKSPLPDLEEYRSFRALKLAQLNPVVLDNPREFPSPPPPEEEFETPVGSRVSPRNPRSAVEDGGLELISDFFNSGEYVPGENEDDKKPVEWWMQFGGDAPELMKIALRILGLCCSSSGCERNWSTFEFIHTKKRNRLEHKRLNDLVYVQYNRRLRERFIERKNHPEKSDPICLADLDWGSEWMTKDAEDLVHDDDNDLTWAAVDIAMGASEERLRRGKMPQRGSTSQPMPMVSDDEEENHSDQEEEAEEEDDDDNASWESDGEHDDEDDGDEDGNMAPEHAPFGFKI